MLSFLTGIRFFITFPFFTKTGCAFPARPLPQDGRALLHRQEQGQARTGRTQEDDLLHGHRRGQQGGQWRPQQARRHCQGTIEG